MSNISSPDVTLMKEEKKMMKISIAKTIIVRIPNIWSKSVILIAPPSCYSSNNLNVSEKAISRGRISPLITAKKMMKPSQ